VEVRLLGPVEFYVAGQTMDLGVPQRRSVLAALAVDAGRLVSLEMLIERVWGATPPLRVESGIYAHVARLRRVLERASTLDGYARATLDRQPGGYLLRLPPDSVDLLRFRGLAATARGVNVPPGERARLLTEALALWRGTALAGVPGDWARRMRDGWALERLDATVVWARAEILHGNAGGVLGPLSDLLAEQPLAESVIVELVRALAATGRGADALDWYGRARRRLVEELGTEPGPELQAVYSELLHGERPVRLAGPLVTVKATGGGGLQEGPDGVSARQAVEVQDAAPSPLRYVPRQLPAPAQVFTGRTSELADLDGIHDASTVVIVAINGMAGVGKTALAVQVAHQMLDRYPDGQLFVDLHGHTAGVSPMEAGEALDRMLRSLGVLGERIPASFEERAGLYRSRLADQRMLIVLDNAAAEAQVTPLLPGAPGCLVLVTSRHRLAGLDHTHALTLDTLPSADAITLLRRIADESQLADQPPEALAELVELCGRLPLAIRIAAARLRSHATWTAAHLTERLRDQHNRLGELAVGQRSVTAALDLSYQHLDADLRCAYRLLGLHPGPDVDFCAAAALLDAIAPRANRLLEQLLGAHLLQEPVAGRYRFHDLTRAHAAQTAYRDETEDDRRLALDRLFDYYRNAATAAMDTAYPFEREHRSPSPPARTTCPALSDPAAALNWLDSEMPNLLATATYAAENDSPAHLLHLSTVLHRHLHTRGQLRDALLLHQQALTTARVISKPAAGLEPLNGFARIHHWRGGYEHAIDHFRQALRLACSTGHQPAVLDALTGLGWVHLTHGRCEQAIDHFQQVLRLARTTDQQTCALEALTGLGQLHKMQGRYEQAAHHYQRALQLAHMAGHRIGEQAALTSLGWIHRRQGQFEQAIDRYHRLLDLANHDGDRTCQFEAHQGLGRVELATGHPVAALSSHDQALTIALQLSQLDDQARAHDGLAHAHLALHEPEQACEQWQHAVDILIRLRDHHSDEESTTVTAIVPTR
jgi:tetratricopeptide (TPR) repeat protein